MREVRQTDDPQEGLIAESYGTGLWNKTFVREDGETVHRTVVSRKDAVAVVAYQDGKIIITQQSREVVGNDHMKELPAGKIESHQSPLGAAIDELKQETGINADKWKRLSPKGGNEVSPGYTTERIVIYLAQQLSVGGATIDPKNFDYKQALAHTEFDHDENIQISWVDIEDVLRNFLQYSDMKTVAAVARALAAITGKIEELHFNLTPSDEAEDLGDDSNVYGATVDVTMRQGWKEGNTFRVEIGSHRFPLTIETDNEENVDLLADFVDEHVEEIAPVVRKTHYAQSAEVTIHDLLEEDDLLYAESLTYSIEEG